MGGCIVNVVVYATDTRYAPCAAASIRSLMSTWADNTPPSVAVLDCGMTDCDRHKLADSFGASVEIVRFDYRSLLRLPHRLHFGSAAAYARLLIGEVLPADVERILYLDCDTLVVRSVADHFAVDLEGRLVGAVPDASVPLAGQRYARYGHVPLGLLPGAPYFNNGVLLIDRYAWHSENIGRRCLRFVDEHRDTLLFPGQDALNAVAATRITTIDSSWNDMPVRDATGTDRPIDMNPGTRVLHFAGPSKPWQASYADSLVASLYRRALHDTAFGAGSAAVS
jgi:lipopolysaccharide biosynthesis glycosyltransferase